MLDQFVGQRWYRLSVDEQRRPIGGAVARAGRFAVGILSEPVQRATLAVDEDRAIFIGLGELHERSAGHRLRAGSGHRLSSGRCRRRHRFTLGLAVASAALVAVASPDVVAGAESAVSVIAGQSLGPAPVIGADEAPIEVSAVGGVGVAVSAVAVSAGGSLGGVVAPAIPAPDKTNAPTLTARQRPRFLRCNSWSPFCLRLGKPNLFGSRSVGVRTR